MTRVHVYCEECHTYGPEHSHWPNGIHSAIYSGPPRERWKKQDRFYDKATGVQGNCLKAVIASILDLPMADVPEFGESKQWRKDLYEFLDQYGFWLEERYKSADSELYVPKHMTMVCGPSSRGCQHIVIYKKGVLFHDPHPSGEGVLQVQELWFLIPKDPASAKSKVEAL